MKKISAFIFILLVSLSSLALFVDAAQRPRALPLPNNNRLMLPSAKPTVQVQLSHSPVLEDDDLEMTIRAKDDKGVMAISVAPSFSQPIIENCQVNGRSPRTCEKGFVFRMPRGQQRFIITAIDDENQRVVKTVNVNVLAVNEDIDVRVTGPQLGPEDFEELPLELELLVTIEGVAKGRLCYRADYKFPVQNGNARSTQEGSSFDCKDEMIRTRLNNGQFVYQTGLEIELFEPAGDFERGFGEYHADIEVWLEDENGRYVEEENEENNEYESTVRVERSCEERVDNARREIGEAQREVLSDHQEESYARRDLGEAEQRNTSEEELRRLLENVEETQERTDEALEEEQEAREELREIQEECGIFENPDLVITNARFIPDPTVIGQPFTFEFEYQNQGNAPVYGPISYEFWFPQRDELGNLVPGGFNVAGYINEFRDDELDAGEQGIKRIEWEERHGLRVNGTFPFNIGIDTCERFCWREDYRHMPLLDNTVPELNDENNVYRGTITTVQQ